MIKKAISASFSVKVFAPVLVAVSALLPHTAWAQADPALPETGVWLDDSGMGAVEIYICQEKANRLCGRIVWLKEPLNAEGQPKHDRYNPKPELKSRPICGLPVLGNLARDSDGGFDGGWIYDPKVGKSYSAAIRLSERDRLVVTGYLGLKFMGKSFTWTRAPADLERCDGAPAFQPINSRSSTPPAATRTSAPAKPKAKTPAAASAKVKSPAAREAGTPVAAVPKPKPAQRPVKSAREPGAVSPAGSAMSWSD